MIGSPWALLACAAFDERRAIMGAKTSAMLVIARKASDGAASEETRR
ncbi:MAG: hypothetical protein ACR2LQ_08790 [Acidimicrobiales bacterium]